MKFIVPVEIEADSPEDARFRLRRIRSRAGYGVRALRDSPYVDQGLLDDQRQDIASMTVLD